MPFQVGPAREYEVSVRYRSTEARNGRVLAGRHVSYDGNQNQSYEQYVNRGTPFPSANGEWKEIVIGTTQFQPGEYQVRLSHSHNLPGGGQPAWMWTASSSARLANARAIGTF